MEGGLKESEESFRITILLHSAHPPRSSLSPSLSTTSKHRQSHRRSHRQNLRYSRGHVSQTKQNKKKQKETLSPASSVGLCVAAALLSNILPFYFSSNVKLSLLTSRIYYGCGLLLCSFDCTVYFLVISNLFLLLFLLTSMTPTRVSYYQWLLFFCTTKGCLCETNKYRHVILA